MTLNTWFAIGITTFAVGALITIVAMGMQNHRTNRYTRAVHEYSRAVDEACAEADAAIKRKDFAEARRVLDAADLKRPTLPERPE